MSKTLRLSVQQDDTNGLSYNLVVERKPLAKSSPLDKEWRYFDTIASFDIREWREEYGVRPVAWRAKRDMAELICDMLDRAPHELTRLVLDHLNRPRSLD